MRAERELDGMGAGEFLRNIACELLSSVVEGHILTAEQRSRTAWQPGNMLQPGVVREEEPRKSRDFEED